MGSVNRENIDQYFKEVNDKIDHFFRNGVTASELERYFRKGSGLDKFIKREQEFGEQEELFENKQIDLKKREELLAKDKKEVENQKNKMQHAIKVADQIKDYEDYVFEAIEDGVQSVYNIINWLWFDRRKQKVNIPPKVHQ